MTINIDEDIFIPIVTAIIAIMITFVHAFTIPISKHEAIIEELVTHEQEAFYDLSSANKKIDCLTKELNNYHISQESLERLGASTIEAQRALMASEVYGLDPKPMGAS